MKKYLFHLLLALGGCHLAMAQVICIKCYDQNTPISNGVTNLIQNGGFENSNCTPDIYQSYCLPSSYYGCNVTNWVCIGGGVNTYAQIVSNVFSVIVEGTRANYLGNYFGYPCSSF